MSGSFGSNETRPIKQGPRLRISSLLILTLVLAFRSGSVGADDRTGTFRTTGWFSDERCAGLRKIGPNDRDCVQKCLEEGARLVFIDGHPQHRHDPFVMKNGRLYEGDTLDEVWPRMRKLPPPWWWEQDPAPGWNDAESGRK